MTKADKKYSIKEIRKRNARNNTLTTFYTVFFFVVCVAVVVGIRLLIIGGYNECFWAEDTGVCLAVLNRN